MTHILYLSIQPDGNHIREMDEETSALYSSVEAIMQRATEESILQYINVDAGCVDSFCDADGEPFPGNTYAIVREGNAFFAWDKTKQRMVPFDPTKDIEDAARWEFSWLDFQKCSMLQKEDATNHVLSLPGLSLKKIGQFKWSNENYLTLGKNDDFRKAFLRGDPAAKRIVDEAMEQSLLSELKRTFRDKRHELHVAIKKDKDISSRTEFSMFDVRPHDYHGKIIAQKKKSLSKQHSPSAEHYAFSILRFLRLLWTELGEEEPLTILSELALV